MSEEFYAVGDTSPTAYWSRDGELVVRTGARPDDVPAFIAWLQEGPPKKRWRITKTFPERPVSVDRCGFDTPCVREHLHMEDIEEVWE